MAIADARSTRKVMGRKRNLSEIRRPKSERKVLWSALVEGEKTGALQKLRLSQRHLGFAPNSAVLPSFLLLPLSVRSIRHFELEEVFRYYLPRLIADLAAKFMRAFA